MKKSKFEMLKKFPVDFLNDISEALNDSGKFAHLKGLLKESDLSIESDVYKIQFTIQSLQELDELKKFINDILVPA